MDRDLEAASRFVTALKAQREQAYRDPNVWTDEDMLQAFLQGWHECQNRIDEEDLYEFPV